MGVISFGVGICAGYYFRNTALGREFGKKILIITKSFAEKNQVPFQQLRNKHVTEYKLVLVVRDDLNMSKGKIASQCSHASVLAYKNASVSAPEIADLWEAFGQGKIILRTTSELKLIDLSHQAKKLGLFTNVVCDAGRTEVNAGTKTVLAIGPGPKEAIDQVTAHLKLL